MSRVRVSLLAVLTLLLFTACSPPPEEPDGGGDRSVIAISAGNLRAHALLDNGDVWGWGHNEFGQIGDGTTNDRARAVKV